MSNQRVEPKDLPSWKRALIALQTEVVGIHPRLHAYNVAAGLLPPRTGGELRARLLRLAGFAIGAGTRVEGDLKVSGPWGVLSRLRVGQDCNIGAECVLDLSEMLVIGDRVTIEPGVMILTSTHELDFPQHRAGKVIVNPVSIGDGAWLRARSIVLPGVKIGAGAVVEAGAVVNKDVEPNARVGGIPAAKLEVLGAGDGA
jgi:acetyltransferase-like isoleucine patch superfamily enzyme